MVGFVAIVVVAIVVFVDIAVVIFITIRSRIFSSTDCTHSAMSATSSTQDAPEPAVAVEADAFSTHNARVPEENGTASAVAEVEAASGTTTVNSGDNLGGQPSTGKGKQTPAVAGGAAASGAEGQKAGKATGDQPPTVDGKGPSAAPAGNSSDINDFFADDLPLQKKRKGKEGFLYFLGGGG